MQLVHDQGMLTPEQCRAARALLNWTQGELAERAQISRSTVRGFESGQHELHRSTAAVLESAFKQCDIVLIGEDEQGQGVRFGHPRSTDTVETGDMP